MIEDRSFGVDDEWRVSGSNLRREESRLMDGLTRLIVYKDRPASAATTTACCAFEGLVRRQMEVAQLVLNHGAAQVVPQKASVEVEVGTPSVLRIPGHVKVERPIALLGCAFVKSHLAE